MPSTDTTRPEYSRSLPPMLIAQKPGVVQIGQLDVHFAPAGRGLRLVGVWLIGPGQPRRSDAQQQRAEQKRGEESQLQREPDRSIVEHGGRHVKS